mmetsp:Transcript_20385/g.65188  ORF Transcript_20385/g.65188 Transcript_20385/m.65188 type:complete len:86 (+) Transcript_20385:694-951(+)
MRELGVRLDGIGRGVAAVGVDAAAAADGVAELKDMLRSWMRQQARAAPASGSGAVASGPRLARRRAAAESGRLRGRPASWTCHRG